MVTCGEVLSDPTNSFLKSCLIHQLILTLFKIVVKLQAFYGLESS